MTTTIELGVQGMTCASCVGRVERGLKKVGGVLYPAFGWLLSPVLAAAAMGFSSVFVLSNALRLRGFRPPVKPDTAAVAAHPSLPAHA